MTQKVCSPDCAEKFAVLERCKAQKKERIEKLKRMKPRAQHMREALAAFNAWIRERDKDEPCISCGRHHGGHRSEVVAVERPEPVGGVEPRLERVDRHAVGGDLGREGPQEPRHPGPRRRARRRG